jgi:hypothetical protein
VRPRTNNIIDLFVHLTMNRRAHPLFLPWPMISCVAACIGNRVRVVTPDIPHGLNLNLFIALIGDSASGKSWATGEMVRMLEQANWTGKINFLPGRFTFEGVIAEACPTRKHPENSQLYLVQEELGSDIGANKELTANFVKGLTKVYMPNRYSQGTKGAGRISIPDGHAFNVLWASTLEWFQAAITPDLAIGGFMPRLCTIWLKEPYEQPFHAAPPEGWEGVEGTIVQRLSELLVCDGIVTMDDEAYAEFERWFHHKPKLPPGTNGIRWDLWIPKLAAINRMAEDDEMVIHKHDILRAEEWAFIAAQQPIEYLGGHSEHASAEVYLLDFIAKADDGTGVRKSVLTHRMHNHGVNGSMLSTLLRNLRRDGKIDERKIPTHGNTGTRYSLHDPEKEIEE